VAAVGEYQGVRCEREGCRHPYVQHAPGGGNCMYWFPLNSEHCGCHGFRWVAIEQPVPPPYRRG
jgi:hypothetical protein